MSLCKNITKSTKKYSSRQCHLPLRGMIVLKGSHYRSQFAVALGQRMMANFDIFFNKIKGFDIKSMEKKQTQFLADDARLLTQLSSDLNLLLH